MVSIYLSEWMIVYDSVDGVDKPYIMSYSQFVFSSVNM